MTNKEYLQITAELAEQSFNNGGFPAGAIVVDKDGNVYKSGDSKAWSHGELQAIDSAIEKLGGDLSECTLYTSMRPCLMCSSKIYWSGIKSVFYIVSKEKVNHIFCYESDHNMDDVLSKFNNNIEFTQESLLEDQLVELYEKWEKKILS